MRYFTSLVPSQAGAHWLLPLLECSTTIAEFLATPALSMCSAYSRSAWPARLYTGLKLLAVRDDHDAIRLCGTFCWINRLHLRNHAVRLQLRHIWLAVS